MAQSNVYKPRYSFTNRAQSKIWVHKNSYLRRFYERRSRRVKRGGLFRRYVLVANNRKWTIARRYIRPTRRRSRRRIKFASSTVYGRPAKRLYSKAFSQKQQLRFFYGITKEHAFTSFFRTHRVFQGLACSSFFSQLESRLDRTLYRRRLFPTIFACRQYVYHHGVLVNNKIETSPRSDVQVGDSMQIPISTWKQLYWDLFCRIYYRRWGQYLFSRRFYSRFKKKIFKARWQSFRFFRSKPKKFKWYDYNSSIHMSNLFTLIKKNTKKKAGNDDGLRSLPKKQARKNFWTKNFLTQTNKFASRGTTLLSAIKKPTRFTKKDRRNWVNIRFKLDQRGYNTFKNNSKRLFNRYFSNINASHHWFSPADRFRSGTNEKLNVYAESSSYKSNTFFSSPLTTKHNINAKSTFSRRRFSRMTPFYTNLSNFLEQRIVAQEQRNQKNISENVISFDKKSFSRKNKQLLAFFYAQKARKLFLPTYKKLSNVGSVTDTLRFQNKRNRKQKFRKYSLKRAWTFRRQIRRFIRRWRFYSFRNRKFLRLKPVHLFIPSYLQYDFRTLQIVKMTAPITQQIYTGFRVSPSKMYSYYKSRGF